MNYQQPFSTAYFPPMPVMDAWIAAPADQNWVGPFTAIIDTGADFTLVPISWLLPLNPPVVRPAILSSQWQEEHSVYVYEIDPRLGDLILPAVDVAGDPFSKEVLLGRNVLNQLDIRLQGPAYITHLLV
ncbi:MAG: hypothetical protein ACP5J4_10560 [Anaerolineae bacterium]